MDLEKIEYLLHREVKMPPHRNVHLSPGKSHSSKGRSAKPLIEKSHNIVNRNESAKALYLAAVMENEDHPVNAYPKPPSSPNAEK
jgi:hypothetical protein